MAFIGDINPLTTIACPTDNAWAEATDADADMRLIVQALLAGTEIQKKISQGEEVFQTMARECF